MQKDHHKEDHLSDFDFGGLIITDLNNGRLAIYDKAPSDLAVVIGAGSSGCAATKLLQAQGYRVRLLDTTNIPNDMQAWARDHDIEMHIGEHKAEHFVDADMIVPSPGVNPAKIRTFLPIDMQYDSSLFVAETELAYRYLGKEKIIAITGTSGKTTTASLIAEMLKAGGEKVFLGGNIGTPLSSYILSLREGKEAADVIVLELSSFQLQLCSSLRADIALLTNISENHLDYHANMKEYVDAKMRLFENQKAANIAIVHESAMHYLEKYHAEASLHTIGQSPYEGSRFTDMKLLGKHNQINAEMAALACHFLHIPFEVCLEAARNFQAIEHRLEKVAEKNGVSYINDSKCTTCKSLKVALEACPAHIWLLAGGVYKGGDLSELLPLLQEKVKGVALFGGSREIFEAAWQGHVPIAWNEHLQEAIHRLHKEARQGETVLLAPATSSFDQYSNYMRRGEDFKQIVSKL